MNVSKEKELVKRISKLAKQNQDLEARIKDIKELNEKLQKENEKYKNLVSKLKPGKITDITDDNASA